MAGASRDRYRGCLLGLALGDALGAPFEGGMLERMVWRWIGRTREGKLRYTDDTRMALDVAQSWLAVGRLDQEDLASRFAASYRYSRGYGPGAARLLKRIRAGQPWQSANRSVHPEGSYGNGGAMRAPVLALCVPPDRKALIDAARRSAEITHAHPLGMEGAVLIALATRLALDDRPVSQCLDALLAVVSHESFRSRVLQARDWLRACVVPEPASVARTLGAHITAIGSCVTSIYLALRFRDAEFLSLVGFARDMGGDVDTIGAMAGAIWGAFRGAGPLPQDRLEQVEDLGLLTEVADALHRGMATDLKPVPPPESVPR